ncbi:OmpA family protein [Actinomadura madurae]|uniref:OmpA family protein n=1 Tax=Actinomadura madurae TaxID=1993 RepID=UPI00399A13C7
MKKALPLLAVFLLSGCSTEALLGGSGTKATDSAPPKARCEEVLTQPTGETPAKDVTVLLADGSASGYVKKGKARQNWNALLAAKFPDEGDVLISAGVFGGSVDWRLQKLTPGKSTDETRTSNDIKDARACFKQNLAEVLAAPPSRSQTDVLRALAQGADQVRRYPGDKRVYIATDGLSNTGCADLRAAPIDDLTAIEGMVRGCAPELPKLDKTFHVRFLGLGYPGAGWSDVKTPDRSWLVELWRKLCAATGADCEEPDSQAPVQTEAGAATPPDDAEVRMPHIKVQPGNPAIMTIPASLLFDVDSAELASGRSQQALAEIFKYLENVRYTKVQIAGYTDSTGTPSHNRKLSISRAENVLRALETRGVTGLTAQGHGEKDPACTPEYKNGAPDPIAMACNRRVEISVYT